MSTIYPHFYAAANTHHRVRRRRGQFRRRSRACERSPPRLPCSARFHSARRLRSRARRPRRGSRYRPVRENAPVHRPIRTPARPSTPAHRRDAPCATALGRTSHLGRRSGTPKHLPSGARPPTPAHRMRPSGRRTWSTFQASQVGLAPESRASHRSASGWVLHQDQRSPPLTAGVDVPRGTSSGAGPRCPTPPAAPPHAQPSPHQARRGRGHPSRAGTARAAPPCLRPRARR